MSTKRPIEEVGDDEVLPLQDIINEDNELETMANAVLSGSNDQACTYIDGYVARQALYACATCKTEGDAGICLACSLECHDGHELYELYTKRNFRCDCGNSKFLNFKCSLFEMKQRLNDNNSYNHNFKGKYCTCKRPYPDPEDDVDDEMIQCIVCEDWFHSRHLLGKPPSTGYAEMICHECMKEKAKFLRYYLWSFEQTEFVDVCVLQESSNGITSSGQNKEIKNERVETSTGVVKNETCRNNDDVSDRESLSSRRTENSVDSGIAVSSGHECLLHLMKKYESRELPDTASFWPEQWRERLCCCTECKIKLQEVKFLYNLEDTVAEYEKIGAHKYNEPSEVSGMKALSGMNHVQQVEVIQGYNDMKDKLSTFLKTFAEEGKVVTAQDIQGFFQRMSETKRPRLNLTHSCK